MLNVTAMNSFETVTLFLSPCTRSGCCVHLPVPAKIQCLLSGDFLTVGDFLVIFYGLYLEI